jgi:hypothetical protein
VVMQIADVRVESSPEGWRQYSPWDGASLSSERYVRHS